MPHATNHSDSSPAFKYRLIFTVVLLNLLVYSLAGFSLYHGKITYEKQATTTAQNIASILEQNIHGEIDKIDISLIAAKKEIERQMSHGGIEEENVNNYIKTLHSYLPAISALRMANAKGDLVYGTGLKPGISVNIADRDYFIFGQDSSHIGLFLSKPTLGRVTKRWVVNVARRVNAPDGSFAGIVFGSLTLEHFNTLFSSIDVGKKGSVSLRDNDLALIVRYPEIDNATGSKVVSKYFSDMYKAGNNSATYKGIAGIDNTERMISYRKVSDYPFVIVAALASDEYLAEWRKEVKTQTGFVALFTLVTMVSSKLLSIRWQREKAIESELRKSKDELELRVEQRTYDLNLAKEKLIVELTERKQMEEELRNRDETFSQFMRHSPVYVYIKEVTPTGSRVLQASDNFEEMVGIAGSDMMGKMMSELFPAEFAAKTDADDRAVIARGEVLKIDEDLNGRNYTTIKFPLVQGERNVLAGYSIDNTERKCAEEQRIKLEQQLLHAQKLESLGILAGGIAHDFNNILMAIIGNADLALMRINKESPATENLHRIEQAAARAADLAKQMLAYSGKGKFVIETIDLNNLLEDMLHMLEVSISKKAVLRINPHQPLPQVEADATQIRQIIMNLVINASEAIGDRSGVIAITTGCMDCDKKYLKDVWLEENLTEGLYVYLEIADTGCGMDNATLAKIFDPFFTTKFTGRGLGMAAVLGIVRGHKGAIKIYSEPKKGTTFKLLFPASNRPVEIFNHVSDSDNWRGSGTVLLVDDEETVRAIGKEMLQELGFSAITADDGKEAVEMFKTRPDIALVILDLTMPHMDGEKCFRELRQIDPNIKVIMSSGFNEQDVTQKFVGKRLAGFIQKPYKLSVLRDAIRKI